MKNHNKQKREGEKEKEILKAEARLKQVDVKVTNKFFLVQRLNTQNFKGSPSSTTAMALTLKVIVVQ